MYKLEPYTQNRGTRFVRYDSTAICNVCMILQSSSFNFLVSCLIFAETYLPVFLAVKSECGDYI